MMLSSRLLLLLVCLFLSVTTIQARVLKVPSPWARIQHAVNAANDGDTIQLSPMIYNGMDNLDIKIMNKGLTIIGIGDPAQVVIDASGEDHHRGFLVLNTTSATKIANLTIVQAHTDLNDPVDQSSGGGILAKNSQLSVSNCRFAKDGALEWGGAVYAEFSTIQVENCVFDSCAAWSGGAIYVSDCNVCTVIDSRFSSCWALAEGGTFFARRSHVTIEGCEFSDCYGLKGSSVHGGAIYSDFGTMRVTASRFLRNFVGNQGGAIYCLDSSLSLEGSLFADNFTTIGYSGGGKALTGDGGTLFFSGGTCRVNSCTIVGTLSFRNHSAVYISADSAEVSKSIIANSDSCFAFTGNATFTCSDIFGNELGDWTGTIASQLGQNGNVSADPQFCLAFPGDYRVALGSPCDPAVSDCGLLIGSEPAECDVVCGDADFSGRVSISDAVFLIRYIFANGDPPLVPSSGDVSCNGVVNISDVVYLVNYIFANGPVPCAACP